MMEDSGLGGAGGPWQDGAGWKAWRGSHPCWAGGWGWFLEGVGYEQRFQWGGLSLVGRCWPILAQLGWGGVVRPEHGRGLECQGKDPGHSSELQKGAAIEATSVPGVSMEERVRRGGTKGREVVRALSRLQVDTESQPGWASPMQHFHLHH